MASGQGDIIRWGQFQATKEVLLLWAFAAIFRKTALNSDFI